ncbi:MAG: ABC transporter permease [Thermodesulfovibrionales bacterium]|nr:ABC transporter permease [Thermodesulfovibrionales bacterium]
MIKLIFLYSIRNMKARKVTTILTSGGMALVVFVFATVLMLSEGLKKTLVSTGTYDNLIVIKKGSVTEVQSGIERQKASLVETMPEIAMSEDGKNLIAKEIVVLMVLQKKKDLNPANVVIRGVTDKSLTLRPQIRIIEGRLPKEGSHEIIVGKSISDKFEGIGIGESIRFAMRDWRVVGIFDAGNRGYNSEIWGDIDQMMSAFRRPVYSSILFKLRDNSEFEMVKEKIEKDPRLSLEVKRETKYYEEQSEMMATFLRILGLSLTIIFSLGAVIGAMITMYSAVANRINEIGTLRALGFQRIAILGTFVAESMFLGLIGGIVGLFFASFMQYLTISTMNWQTFSELAFSFALTFDIVYQALLFSIFMGVSGGLLPAFNAARKNIVDALRTV